MAESPNAENHCVACKSSILAGATVCPECGTLQGWMRHLQYFNPPLSLVISIVALALSAAAFLIPYVEQFSQNNILPRERYTLGISTLNLDEARAIITNRSAIPAVFDDITCQIFVPILTVGFRNEGPVLRRNGVGTFMLNYRAGSATLVPPMGSATIDATLWHVTPPMDSAAEYQDDQEVGSVCYSSGTDHANEIAIAPAILEPLNLLSFDALELVARADFSELQTAEKRDLVDKINVARDDALGQTVAPKE